MQYPHQDWKPVVLKKSQPTKHIQKRDGNKERKKIESDDPEPLKTLGLSAAKQIQQARLSKKWSQKDLANKLNIKPNLIKDYETGKVVPNPQILNKINRLLGIKIQRPKK